MTTQIPVTAAPQAAGAPADQRYPAGSRVVLVGPGNRVTLLSKGLFSAGAPVVSPSADRVYFAGKPDPNGTWQLYETTPGGGQPRAITGLPGGAIDPAIMAGGGLVFSSPVPNSGQPAPAEVPAIYALVSGRPRRLTFGPAPALTPTVLADGRILFVSARSAPGGKAAPEQALFTINNDGTEVTAFAGHNDGAAVLHRPRELPHARVGFLASTSPLPGGPFHAEAVRKARPFLSRTNLFPWAVSNCRSVEPDGQDGVLACPEVPAATSRSFAVYRLSLAEATLPAPIYDDPAWHEVEAVSLATRPMPIGHVTAVMESKSYGTILCLDANFTRPDPAGVAPKGKAHRIRVLAALAPGRADPIGEVPLQADGSFMAQVPVDVPLGFETLDAAGQVLRRSEPFFWLRPGENRSCIGCHEPYNRTLRNQRPLAAGLAPVDLLRASQGAASQAR